MNLLWPIERLTCQARGVNGRQAADLLVRLKILRGRQGPRPKPPSTMKTRRGEVVLVLCPNSDLRAGQSAEPALVLQRDDFRGSGIPQTIVAMISSNLGRRGHPSRVFVAFASSEGKADAGLRLDSVIMTDNVATVFETEVDSVLGRLPGDRARLTRP